MHCSMHACTCKCVHVLFVLWISIIIPCYSLQFILYCTVLYYIVLYCTVLYCNILHVYCTVLYYTVLYYTVLYYTVLYYIVLYCSEHGVLLLATCLLGPKSSQVLRRNKSSAATGANKTTSLHVGTSYIHNMQERYLNYPPDWAH